MDGFFFLGTEVGPAPRSILDPVLLPASSISSDEFIPAANPSEGGVGSLSS